MKYHKWYKALYVSQNQGNKLWSNKNRITALKRRAAEATWMYFTGQIFNLETDCLFPNEMIAKLERAHISIPQTSPTHKKNIKNEISNKT